MPEYKHFQTCPQCGFHSLGDSENTMESENLPSPIEALLQNNESPDSESSFDTQSLLSQAEHALADLDSQIERMQTSISRLSERRERITVNIQAYRTVLHPIRRLPREVILEIFEWCLPGLRVVSSLSAKAPWVLGQLSRHWRSIALSSPTLW
ncbi:hypothetical protein BT96DRAFT_858542, partial [Gymnopus androsaceus JB14]